MRKFLSELHVVNESDSPVAIDDFEGTLIVDKTKMPMKYVVRMFDFRIHTVDGEHGEQNIYSQPDALMDKVAGIALAQGIAYRGWVRFEVRRVKQKKAGMVQAKMFVVDTLGRKHSVKQNKRKPWMSPFGFCRC